MSNLQGDSNPRASSPIGQELCRTKEAILTGRVSVRPSLLEQRLVN